MRLSKTAAGFSFLGALAIGTLAAFLVPSTAAEPAAVSYRLGPVPAAIERVIPVRAEDLVGVWRGTWDHGQHPCTLEISRVEGNKFYGILKENEAEVAFSGTIDSGDRRVFFHETKVNRLGAYSEWSLGTNSGAFSPDGRTLAGSGIDKWGVYKWKLTKE